MLEKYHMKNYPIKNTQHVYKSRKFSDKIFWGRCESYCKPECFITENCEIRPCSVVAIATGIAYIKSHDEVNELKSKTTKYQKLP